MQGASAAPSASVAVSSARMMFIMSYGSRQLASTGGADQGLGRELGFAAIRIAHPEMPEAEAGLFAWLQAGCHGEMDYMARHGAKRARPPELLPGTRAIIMARLNYRPTPPAPNRTSAMAIAPMSRAMRWAAITTSCCARDCRSWPSEWSRRPVRPDSGSSSIRHR